MQFQHNFHVTLLDVLDIETNLRGSFVSYSIKFDISSYNNYRHNEPLTDVGNFHRLSLNTYMALVWMCT